MACKDCLESQIEFKMDMLLSDSDYNKCTRCRKLKDTINEFHASSYLTYNLELRRKFHSIFPMYTENEIIFIKPEMFDIKGFDEDKTLKDTFERIEILGTSCSTHEEINYTCDRIMGDLLHQLSSFLIKNPTGYLIALQSTLEYNFHVTGACVLWTSNYTDNEFIDSATDDFTHNMLKSLENQKKNDFSGNYKGMYKDWEGQLSFDKYALQYGIELVHNYSKKLISEEQPFNQYIFGEIFSVIRAIYRILFERESAIENIKNGYILSISKKGNLSSYNNIDIDKFAELYVNSMGSKLGSGLSSDAMNMFNKICEKHLNVTLSEIMEAPSRLTELFKQGDDFLIGSREFFELLFAKIFNRSSLEVGKIIEYLLNEGNNFEYAFSTQRRTNKVLNHCLMKLHNGLIICQVQFLSISLFHLGMDILEANMSEGNFKNELSKYSEKFLDNEFENQIAKMLSGYFPEAIVKVNIPKDKTIPIVDTKDFITFYGEIDVLFYYREELFLIECKNKSLKITPKSLNNDLNSFKKLGEKSFQYKINQKLNQVFENWYSVIAYMGVKDYKNVTPKAPTGVFVTSNLTLASFEEGLPIPVMDASQLIKWITEKVSR